MASEQGMAVLTTLHALGCGTAENPWRTRVTDERGVAKPGSGSHLQRGQHGHGRRVARRLRALHAQLLRRVRVLRGVALRLHSEAQPRLSSSWVARTESKLHNKELDAAGRGIDRP